MKKKIAVLLVVFVMGSSVAYAQYAPHLIAGPVGIGIGALLLNMPELGSTGQLCGWVFIIAGGADLALGVVFWALGEPAFVSEVRNNPVLQHVSLSAWKDKVYLGASFPIPERGSSPKKFSNSPQTSLETSSGLGSSRFMNDSYTRGW